RGGRHRARCELDRPRDGAPRRSGCTQCPVPSRGRSRDRRGAAVRCGRRPVHPAMDVRSAVRSQKRGDVGPHWRRRGVPGDAWTAMRAYGRRLPLINQVLDTIYETLSAQGVHMEMGFDLYRTFKDAGLPAPTMRLEMILGGDAAMATALADLARSVAPTATTLGDLDTLAERILGQVQGAQTVMALNTLVSAWAVRS